MLVLFVGVYLALFLYAVFLSDGVIFQPHPSSYKDGPETIKLTTTTGKRISAVYLRNPAAPYVLLVSHGNAEDLGDLRFWLEDLRKTGFSVLAYDYEGYGTSEGKPSEQAAYSDESSAYDYLIQTQGFQAEKIIILGRSVGSGPAVHIAARKPVAGLVLQSPFVSAFRVLTRIPLLPFDKFPNYKEIGRVRCPVLIIHGQSDQVIAPWHGKKLFELANQPKTYLPIPKADHNDVEMIAGKVYYQALIEFAQGATQQPMTDPTRSLD